MAKVKRKPTAKGGKSRRGTIKITLHGNFTPANDNAPELGVFMLLDRSGSMSDRWDEAVSSINSYVADLAKQRTKARITLATFDEQQGLQFDVLRNQVSAASWHPISLHEASPRGGTPLYDAFARIVAKAKLADFKRTVIVVMTDGYENASREINRSRAGELVRECQTRDWQVVFLGADFDARGQAAEMHVYRGSTLNMTRGFYGSGTAALSEASVSYAATGESFNFSDEDRKAAAGRGGSAQGQGQGTSWPSPASKVPG